MASNDQWPPVTLASSGKGSGKINGNKRNIKESQRKVLKVVNEMFASALEPGVILSVVQNCNWELQPSIEGLITVAETVVDYLAQNDSKTQEEKVPSLDSGRKVNESTKETILEDTCVTNLQQNLTNVEENQQSLLTLPTKLDKLKKGGSKNRMGSFCGNIARLKSSGENNPITREISSTSSDVEQKCKAENLTESDSLFNDWPYSAIRSPDNSPTTIPKLHSFGDFSGSQRSLKNAKSPSSDKKYKNAHKNRNPTNKNKRDNRGDSPKDSPTKTQKVATFNSKTTIRKNESESLCGLKVQYRLSGMESSSDDDADVVIEDESSDYTINLSSTSVSQFLSPSTQTPPQLAKTEIRMINTPSPPRTPQHNIHEATLTRIKTSIAQGNKIMIFLRGLPGSGKTTLARSILSNTIGANPLDHIFSADDFFVTLGRGTYKFDPTKLSDAHTMNQKRVRQASKDGRSPIFVDNTNIQSWQMRPYADIAVKHGYTMEMLEPNTPWAWNIRELGEKNVHGLTKWRIRDISDGYERDITGQKLLDMYGLKYSTQNLPPQLRLVPPIPMETTQQKVPAFMADIKSNWDNHQKNDFVLTSHDIESMQNIDESHNSMNECNIGPDDSSYASMPNCQERTSTYCEKVFNDYLQELQDSDDESFELLESSGSEHPSDISRSLDSKDTTNSHCSEDVSKNTKDELAENYEGRNNEPSPNSTLGAIGSERKGSVAAAPNGANQDDEKKDAESKDNVMSQCWDFTMILGRYKLHSKLEAVELSSHSIADEKKPIVGTGVSEDTLNETQKSEVDEKMDIVLKSIEDIMQTPMVKMIELIPNEETIEPITNEKTIELISKEESIESISEEVTLEPIAKEESHEIESDNVTDKDRKTDNLIEVLEKEDKVDSHDAQVGEENIASDELQLVLGSGILEEKEIEKLDEPSPTTTNPLDLFIFNLMNTSILGTGDDSWKAINKPENTEGANEEEDSEIEISEDQKEEDSENIDIVDSGKMDQIVSESEKVVTQTDSIEVEEKVEHSSTNLSCEETVGSQSEKEHSDVFLNDNINSISWKESPFPLDGANIPVVESYEDNRTVQKTEASTNTTYYDFNVAYVGGTSEPEYRELWGVNRCINEAGTSVVNTERPPLKLMLDKSSMTSESNILANEANPNADKEKDSISRLDDLIEMFPHFPREYLKVFYEQQCNCNFDWAVDVLLLADVPSDFTIENYKRTIDNANCAGGDTGGKLRKIEHERVKQRSHSSSPRNRRNRAKDFRSFSLECVEDCNWSNSERTFYNEGMNFSKDEEADHKMLEMIYANRWFDGTNTVIEHKDSVEVSSSPTTSGWTNEVIEDETEEIMELDFGQEFINQLEKTFGEPGFTLPNEFKPVIRIKKSMAEELHGLWIQSMYRQMNELHAQLDNRMANDEALARAVDREETASSIQEPMVPNLEEIMDMEMALASYKNDLKEVMERETPNDLASRLTRQMLYESLPDIDQETLSEILKAHGGNFKETCEILEASTGRTISKSDTLKKQRSLLDRVNEERKNRDIEQISGDTSTPLIVVKQDIHGAGQSEKFNCKTALKRARDARLDAQKHFSLRVENFNKAAAAYRKGYPEVAAYYSQMAKLHSENMEAAHADAAEEYLSAQIYTMGEENTLDLHNLFVPEALQAMDQFLDCQLKKLAKSNKRSMVLYVITGRGARSNNGLSRIKPAISKQLISRNIRFTEANPGCLKVTLSKRNGTLD